MTTKGLYTVVTAKRKASGSGYDFKRKTYRYLSCASRYYFDHYNEFDNIYVVDEITCDYLLVKNRKVMA